MRVQVAKRKLIVSSRTRFALRVSTACMLALGVSACSSDATRFSEAPFSNPFKTAQAPSIARDPATTGSIGRAASAPVSAPAVAAVRSQPLPPPQSAVALRSAAPVPVAGNATGWSAQGGTPIVIAQGETLDTISSRYGVPRAALISANGLNGPNVAPGTRITIPVYNAAAAGAASAPRQLAQSSAPASSVVQNSQVLSDARSEPTRSIVPLAPRAAPAKAVIAAPTPAVAASARSAAASATETKAKASAAAEARAQAAADAKAKAAADAQAMRESRAKFAAEAKAKADARRTAAASVAAPASAQAPVAAKPVAKPVAKPAVAASTAPAPTPSQDKTKPTIAASAPPAQPKPAAVAKAAPEPVADPKTTGSIAKQPEPEAASEKADFRWPARGRVITGYTGKGGNEGINIAVPEGTPIKAAEGGTVAYAGNELKGYGNLVLIRHPNGYVSAYAHNGDLKVKRGDAVKRGQVVASSGQTGNVSSPQLHFELRKGATPVDPTPYLNN